MGMHGAIDMHYWRTQGMARRLGISFNDVMRTGMLTREDFQQVLGRCRECGCADNCMAVLGTPPQSGARAPVFCPNKGVMDLLQDLA